MEKIKLSESMRVKLVNFILPLIPNFKNKTRLSLYCEIKRRKTDENKF